MIALDTNILVYAHREDSQWHGPASLGVAELAEGRASWAIPWPCLHEFLAIVTHPRIYVPPTQHFSQTVKALVEAGLREVLGGRSTSKSFRLQQASFKGQGVQAGLTEGDWNRIREIAYEGRGG